MTRKRIGLLFVFDESWTGGFYYLTNIISALNFLPEQEKPELVIFFHDESVKQKFKEISYDHLTFYPIEKQISSLHRMGIRILRKFFKSTYFPQYRADMVDFIFPCTSLKYTRTGSVRTFKMIFWIPDFQHKYLPHFFSEKELAQRDKTFSQIASSAGKLVLSSENAQNDFKRFYPESSVQPRVMRFASVLPDYRKLPIESLLKKFGIDKSYFISPNQFWAHKNHLVVLKAVSSLKKKGVEPLVIFTGKEQDYRNPGYFEMLQQYVKEKGLESNVKFLGFIDRKEQLQLMNYSLGVIQPSLFEGWSTVVEDAKAMDQRLIVSELTVHYEQCGDKAFYFDPHDEYSLAGVMEQFLNGEIAKPTFSYQDVIQNYARQLMDLS